MTAILPVTLTPVEQKVLKALRDSPITFGVYQPSEAFRVVDHAAVFVDSKPLILTGWAEDALSVRQAQELVICQDFLLCLHRFGYRGIVDSGVVSGRIIFEEKMSAIVASEVGVTEMGGDQGPLLAVVLDQQNDNLVGAMCCLPGISRILKTQNQPQLAAGPG